VSHDVDAVAQHMQASAYAWVSSRVIAMPENQLGFAKGVLVRDPDGHVMHLVEK
jgi:hypothetical protein